MTQPADHGTRFVRFSINGIVYADLEVLSMDATPRYATVSRNPLGVDRDKVYTVKRGIDLSIVLVNKQSGWRDLKQALDALDDSRTPHIITLTDVTTFPRDGLQKAIVYTGITRTGYVENFAPGEVGTITVTLNAEDDRVIL